MEEDEITVGSLEELGFARNEFLGNTYKLVKDGFTVVVQFDFCRTVDGYVQIFDNCSIVPEVNTLGDVKQLLKNIEALKTKE